jgi:hypothetical protein
VAGIHRRVEASAADPEALVDPGDRVTGGREVGAFARLQEEERALVDLHAAHAAREVDHAEVPGRSRAAVALLEVPGPARRRVRGGWIDPPGREGQARDVAVEVSVRVEARLAGEPLGGRRVEVGGRIDAVTGSDLEAHAVVEEGVAELPDLVGKQVLQREQGVVLDHRALGKPRDGGVVRRAGAGLSVERRAGPLGRGRAGGGRGQRGAREQQRDPARAGRRGASGLLEGPRDSIVPS